jgi:hypothetical protein
MVYDPIAHSEDEVRTQLGWAARPDDGDVRARGERLRPVSRRPERLEDVARDQPARDVALAAPREARHFSPGA